MTPVNRSLFHVTLLACYLHVDNVCMIFTMDGCARGALFGTYSLIDLAGGKAHAPMSTIWSLNRRQS